MAIPPGSREKHLVQWLLTSHINSSGRLYSTASFRALFPDLSQGAYRAVIHRAEKRGLLERVCQGIYQYVGAPDTSGLILFHAAAGTCQPHLETVLSEAGLLCELPATEVVGLLTIKLLGATFSLSFLTLHRLLHPRLRTND